MTVTDRLIHLPPEALFLATAAWSTGFPGAGVRGIGSDWLGRGIVDRDGTHWLAQTAVGAAGQIVRIQGTPRAMTNDPASRIVYEIPVERFARIPVDAAWLEG